MLEGIKRELLSPSAIQEIRRRVAKLIKATKPPTDESKAIAKAEAEISNLTDAIANGLLKTSPALARRLQAAEQELARLRAKAARPRPGSVQQIMPRLVDEYRTLVEDLAGSLTEINVTRARCELRKLIGDIQVNASEHEIRLEASEGAIETALLKAAGQSQVLMVAGRRGQRSAGHPTCDGETKRNLARAICNGQRVPPLGSKELGTGSGSPAGFGAIRARPTGTARV